MSNQGTLLLCVVIFLVILFFISSSCSSDEKYANRFGGLAYRDECEFQPACLWDTARWVQLSNGMEGVCTLHGKACPAFSKDHDRARYVGKSPDMVDDIYNAEAGETAMEMLM
uniref:Uncharacterized protein n=1 Tax=Marseillevirus LCMAC102 TaxID=2506603 RepID=A0A481YTX1_9VIRU|nr:MAG: hypothetical protein LCMAC102_03970 [Marseillevirus LCMAC102]